MSSLPGIEKGDIVYLSPEIEEYTHLNDYTEPIEGVFRESKLYPTVLIYFPSEDKTQAVKSSHIQKSQRCHTHNTKKIYHDKREEWYCPWC